MLGVTQSMGKVSMVNNVNGKEGKVQFGWDGKMKVTKPKRANIELHTEFNGHKNNLKLQNTNISNLKSNTKFKQFFTRLSRTNNTVRKNNGQLSAMPTPASLSMPPPASPYPMSATPFFRRAPPRRKKTGRRPKVFRGRRRGAATRRKAN